MRNRRSARNAGTRFEGQVARYLSEALDDDRIERRAKSGQKDRGDIAGVRFRGKRVVIECKDVVKMDLAGWTQEAEVEAGNDDAGFWAVAHKRRGVSDPAEQYVTMPLKVFAAMLALDPGVLQAEAAEAFEDMIGHPLDALKEMGVRNG